MRHTKALLFGLILSVAFAAEAQNITRFAATTGDVSLVASATTATLQNLAVGQGGEIFVDQIVVYCSAACTVTQAANGTAATATDGTITPILPSQATASIPATFWTSSNVGAGTAQGGAVHIPAGATVILCLTSSCGIPGQVVIGKGGGTAANYSVTIASTTATVNITFIGRAQS